MCTRRVDALLTHTHASRVMTSSIINEWKGQTARCDWPSSADEGETHAYNRVPRLGDTTQQNCKNNFLAQLQMTILG